MSDIATLVLAFWPVLAVIAGLGYGRVFERRRRELRKMKTEAWTSLEGQYRKSGHHSAHGSALNVG